MEVGDCIAIDFSNRDELKMNTTVQKAGMSSDEVIWFLWGDNLLTDMIHHQICKVYGQNMMKWNSHLLSYI